MKSLDIRIATEKEHEWAAGLLAASEPWVTLGATTEQCREICGNPEYLLCIAHLNGNPSGAIIMHPRGLASSPYVKSIVVAAPYRNQGIGAALMDYADAYFRKTSRHLFLCVSSFNSRARTFYERLGYHAVGELEDHVINGASEILMHKCLR